jgi:hypothetical protein
MQALDAIARRKEWFRFVEDGGFSVRTVGGRQPDRSPTQEKAYCLAHGGVVSCRLVMVAAIDSERRLRFLDRTG